MKISNEKMYHNFTMCLILKRNLILNFYISRIYLAGQFKTGHHTNREQNAKKLIFVSVFCRNSTLSYSESFTFSEYGIIGQT